MEQDKSITIEKKETRDITIPNNSTVVIDDKVIEYESYAKKDYNYFKLRDIAYAFKGSKNKFEVSKIRYKLN